MIHFFGLKLAYLIISATEQLSINQQAKDITVQEALRGAQLLSTYLRALRSETKFDSFYNAVIVDCGELTEPPTLPRPRKRPKRFDDGASSHTYNTPNETPPYVF